MRVEKQSVVYDAKQQPESGRVAFFDSLLRLSDGSWLCGMTTGAAKHHPASTLQLARSTDNGDTWQLVPWQFPSRQGELPGSITGAELVEVRPGLLRLFTTWFDRSDPERPLFDPQTEGLLRSRQLVAESRDGGRSWGDWSVVPTPGLTGCAITGPVLQWADGTIAFAFESFKEFDDPAPARHAAWITVSRDGGDHFESPLLVAQDPQSKVYYWDQRLCPAQHPGEFIGLFWTHDRGQQRDLNVHLAQGTLRKELMAGHRLQIAQPVETTLRGQIAAPLLWPDGRLFAFVVDRTQPGTLTLRVSRDNGVSWPAAEMLVVHEQLEQARLSQGSANIDFAQYWEDMGKWSFGHPSIRACDSQRVLLSWYAGVPGALSVHSARVLVD